MISIFCDKLFQNYSNLSSHSYAHNRETPYFSVLCIKLPKLCFKATMQATPEKKYFKSNLHKKWFAEKPKLRIHKGTTQHQCTECEENRFVDRQDLKRH